MSALGEGPRAAGIDIARMLPASDKAALQAMQALRERAA
jgi:hypothetical protein